MITWQIESLSVSRHSNAVGSSETYRDKTSQNEDRWVVQEKVIGQMPHLVAAVIDGAAPLVGPETLPQGVTPGALAAEVVKQAVISADPTRPLKSLLLNANQHIRRTSLRFGADYAKPETLWAAAASLIRINSAGNLEYAHIADTVILVAETAGAILLSCDQVKPFDRAPLLEMQKARLNGILDPDAQLTFARSKMIAQKSSANAPNGAGYGAINGMEDHMVEAYIEEGAMKINDQEKFVALMTDGMLPPPSKIGQNPDWERIVDILRRGGLTGLLLHTRHMEKSDPWLTLPRVKMHDDATGVLIRLECNANSETKTGNYDLIE